MRVLSYYMLHTFVNSIKRIFKKQVIIIMLAFMLIGGVVGGTVAIIMTHTMEESEQGGVEETQESDELDEAGEGIQEKDWELIASIVEAVVGGIALLIILYNLYAGEKTGTSIFRMSDVNFLFPAPMKPQSVLMFRVVLQMGLIIVGSIYLIFQLPNLILNLGIPLYCALSMIVAFILLLLLGKLISVYVYTVVTTRQYLKRYVRGVVYSILVVCLGFYLYFVMVEKQQVWEAAITILAARWSRLIPVWGWIKGIVMYSLEGNFMAATSCFMGVVVAIGVLVYAIWRFKADFYEDAMKSAGELQSRLDAAQEGRAIQIKRSDKLKREGELKGEGASLFLGKFFYNRKRFARFGIATKTFNFYFSLCIITILIMKFVVHSNTITPLSILLLVMIYFRTFGNPIGEEMSNHLFFLIPEPAPMKILYSIICGPIDTVLNILPGYLLAILVLRGNVLEGLLWIFLFMTLDFFASSLGLMIDLLIPSYLPIMVRGMLQSGFSIGIMLFIIIAIVIGSFFSVIYMGLLISTGIGILAGTACCLISQALLHEGRK